MPLILAWLAALAPVVLPLVRRALIGIGFGLVTYQGVGALWTAAQAAIWSNLGASSASILALLGMAKVDQGLKIILAAGTAKLGLMGMNAAGSVIRGRWKFT